MRNFTSNEFADDTLNAMGSKTNNAGNITLASKESDNKWYRRTLSTLWNYIKGKVEGLGYTNNIGTITEIKMNGVSKGTSGVVDLGTVATSDTNTWKPATTSQEGYAPKLELVGTTVGAKTDTIIERDVDYVLTYHSRGDNVHPIETAPVWRKLPETAFFATHLYAGNGTDDNKATTNGNTKLTVTDSRVVRDSVTIKGTGATSVSSDANGVITITSTDSHYQTGLFVGGSQTRLNDASGNDNTYIKLFDDSTLCNQFRVKGYYGIVVRANNSEDNCLEIGYEGYQSSTGIMTLAQCDGGISATKKATLTGFTWTNLLEVWVNFYGTEVSSTTEVTLDINSTGAKKILTGSGGKALQLKHLKKGIYHLMVAENEGFYLLSCPIRTTKALLDDNTMV